MVGNAGGASQTLRVNGPIRPSHKSNLRFPYTGAWWTRAWRLTVNPARSAMVETRIKPYHEQVAEEARRAEQQRTYRRNQVFGLDARGRRRFSDGLCCTPIPRGSFRPAGGAHESAPRTAKGGFATQDHATAPLAVILLGPTGSGKTALSLALGERFGGEIVSCDSVAVYRGMDLGTAKPTAEERARLPHHLIDVADPDQPFTAGEYSRLARAALREIAARGRLPIVTGGTGLYLRALTEGLFAGPQRQHELRNRLERSRQRHGEGWLHRLLITPRPSLGRRAFTPTTRPS